MLSAPFFALSSPVGLTLTQVHSASLNYLLPQGVRMPANYVAAVEALSSNAMLIVLFVAPIIGGIIGAFIARGLFKKHFVKAGIV